jgi:hypothetical protein
MDMVLSLQAMEVETDSAAGNSGASVNCTSGSSVSNHCGGSQTKVEAAF